MKIQNQIALTLLFLGLSMSVFAQELTKKNTISAIHLGFKPTSMNTSLIRNNENFAVDSIFLAPISYNTSGSTVIDYSVEFQHFVQENRLWHLEMTVHSGKADVFLTADTFSTDFTFPFDPESVFSIQDDHREFTLTSSVGHLWSKLSNNEKLLFNYGPILRTNYYFKNYHSYDQLNGEVLKYDKKGLVLGLAMRLELTWRFATKFGLGLAWNANVVQKHFDLSDENDLNPDDPLNERFFGNPLSRGSAALRIGYYF